MLPNLKPARLGALIFAGMGAWGAIAAAGDPLSAASKELHCPVCSMIPANYPKWRTQIVFKDGAIAVFDSPAEMFRFLGNIAKYDSKHSATDIVQMDATDHAKRTLIDARRASYDLRIVRQGPHGAGPASLREQGRC